MKEEPNIPFPSNEDKLEPAKGNIGLATLGVKNIADFPIPSREEVLKSIKDMMDKGYKPVPFNEEQFEPVEWSHVLATLDTCTLNHGIKFCDEEGYDIIPIKMVQVLNGPREKAPVAVQKRKKGMRRRKRPQIFMVSQKVIKDKEPEIIPPFLLDMQLVMTSHAMWTKALSDSGAGL